MIEIFSALRSLFKVKVVKTESTTFVLSTKFTALILLTCSTMLTMKSLFGRVIDCGSKHSEFSANVIESYCFTASTFTVIMEGEEKAYAHPGVGPADATSPEKIVWHNYYQWVPYVLFLQSLMFYIPRYVWKNLEGGKMKKITTILEKHIAEPREVNERVSFVVDFLMDSAHSQKCYVLSYFTCEFLCFANVGLQLFLTNWFLGYEFTYYGLTVFNLMETEDGVRNDFLAFRFPKVTKCLFKSFGPGGNVVIQDNICVLPLNSLIEKIYCVFWFYMVILSLLLLVNSLYRVCLCLGPDSLRGNLLVEKALYVRQADLKRIAKRLEVADWFVLYRIGDNIDVVVYRKILVELAARLHC